MHTTTVRQLRSQVRRSTFSNDGDDFEQQFGTLVTDRFPRLEYFWQQCIVPLSTRIEHGPGLPAALRADVSDDVRLISYLHYTTFLHLLYARFRCTEMESCLKSRLSPFGGFYACYAHLGSACDIVEEFLFKLRVLLLECSGDQIAATELDAKWSKAQTNKVLRHKELDGYFSNSQSWQRYKKFTDDLRKYRNTVVHAVAMGARVDVTDGTHLVPRKEKVQKYRGLIPVLDAPRLALKRDFVPMQEQAQADTETLRTILNRVWKPPLDDLGDLLYTKHNPTLLAKYNISFTR